MKTPTRTKCEGYEGDNDDDDSHNSGVKWREETSGRTITTTLATAVCCLLLAAVWLCRGSLEINYSCEVDTYININYPASVYIKNN